MIKVSERDLLKIKRLNITFLTKEGQVKSVDNVDLGLANNEKMALVGETGCGKSVLAHSILQLLPENARIEGDIIYNEKNLLGLSNEEIRKIRGKEIALIPQSPSSLNPVMKIGDQIGEVIALHRGIKNKNGVLKEVRKSLELVGLEEDVFNKYPHMLSGGMRQRVLVSIGTACSPSLIIADEPTTGLDAMVKNKVVKLLEDVSSNKALLLITHDVDITRICGRIAVMYAGEIVERGKIQDVLENPLHPYTEGFLNSLPSRGLVPIKGSSPSLINPPEGCKFHPRCPYASKECRIKHPELEGDNRKVRCFYAFR